MKHKQPYEKFNEVQGYISACCDMASKVTRALRGVDVSHGAHSKMTSARISMAQGNWKQAYAMMNEVMGSLAAAKKSGLDGDDLEKAKAGSRKAGAKYIKRVKTPKGYRYFYTEDEIKAHKKGKENKKAKKAASAAKRKDPKKRARNKATYLKRVRTKKGGYRYLYTEEQVNAYKKRKDSKKAKADARKKAKEGVKTGTEKQAEADKKAHAAYWGQRKQTEAEMDAHFAGDRPPGSKSPPKKRKDSEKAESKSMLERRDFDKWTDDDFDAYENEIRAKIKDKLSTIERNIMPVLFPPTGTFSDEIDFDIDDDGSMWLSWEWSYPGDWRELADNIGVRNAYDRDRYAVQEDAEDKLNAHLGRVADRIVSAMGGKSKYKVEMQEVDNEEDTGHNRVHVQIVPKKKR